MAETILICKSDKHNKFWMAEEMGNDVVYSWGRVGTKGQKKVYTDSSQWGRQRFIDSKVNEKLRKGYTDTILDKKITKAMLEEFHFQSKILGVANGCHLTWVTIHEEDGALSLRRAADLVSPDGDEIGLLIRLTTRKTYQTKEGPKNHFHILFRDGKAYDFMSSGLSDDSYDFDMDIKGKKYMLHTTMSTAKPTIVVESMEEIGEEHPIKEFMPDVFSYVAHCVG